MAFFSIITKLIDTLGILFPTIAKYLKILLDWIKNQTSLSGITKALSFVVMVNGLATSTAIYIITQGGLWPFFVMFFTNILFPIIMPGRIPVDIIKKEVWRSGWERIFSYFQKLLMALGVFLFASGAMGFVTWSILFIITELPNLAIKSIKFLIIEMFPLILKTIMKLIMEDGFVPKEISGPIKMVFDVVSTLGKAGEVANDVKEETKKGVNQVGSWFGIG